MNKYNLIDNIIYHPNPKNLPQSGDILLFENNKFVSFLIKFGTKSQWSHVGIAIWIKNSKSNKITLYNFEATAADTNNYTNIKTPCVKLSLFENTYEFAHIIAYRRPFINQNKEYLKKIKLFVNNNLHKPFLSINDITEAWWFQDEPYDKNSLFCAQLVGNYLKILELIELDYKTNLIAPSTFGENYNVFNGILQSKVDVYSDFKILCEQNIFILIIILIIIIAIIQLT